MAVQTGQAEGGVGQYWDDGVEPVGGPSAGMASVARRR
jgi:hypothetical protein